MAQLKQGALFASPDQQTPSSHSDSSRTAGPSPRAKRLHATFDEALALTGSFPNEKKNARDRKTARSSSSSQKNKRRHMSHDARQAAREKRFLEEKETKGQGETSSARRLVSQEREYSSDLLKGESLPDQELPKGSRAADTLFAESSSLSHRAGRTSPQSTRSGSSDARDGNHPRWQILPGALGLAVSVYPPDLGFTQGFWNRLQELVDEGLICFDPSCRPLIERLQLIDQGKHSLFGTAPIKVETTADPSVPTLVPSSRKEAAASSSLISLGQFLREAGGF